MDRRLPIEGHFLFTSSDIFAVCRCIV